jgi:integrase
VLSYVPVYRRPQISAMSDAEIGRYIAAAKDYAGTYGALFLVALYTGLRRGELLALKWRDVHWQAQTISVNATLTLVGGMPDENAPKSAAGRRTVSIVGGADTACLNALRVHRVKQLKRRAHCATWEEHDLVFCSDRGTPILPTNLYRAFYAFLEAAGLPKVKFHNLRHTNITAALRAGVNPKAVQAHAGHADVGMTASYAHVTVRDEHEVAGAVAAAFAGARAAAAEEAEWAEEAGCGKIVGKLPKPAARVG